MKHDIERSIAGIDSSRETMFLGSDSASPLTISSEISRVQPKSPNAGSASDFEEHQGDVEFASGSQSRSHSAPQSPAQNASAASDTNVQIESPREDITMGKTENIPEPIGDRSFNYGKNIDIALTGPPVMGKNGPDTSIDSFSQERVIGRQETGSRDENVIMEQSNTEGDQAKIEPRTGQTVTDAGNGTDKHEIGNSTDDVQSVPKDSASMDRKRSKRKFAEDTDSLEPQIMAAKKTVTKSTADSRAGVSATRGNTNAAKTSAAKADKSKQSSKAQTGNKNTTKSNLGSSASSSKRPSSKKFVSENRVWTTQDKNGGTKIHIKVSSQPSSKKVQSSNKTHVSRKRNNSNSVPPSKRTRNTVLPRKEPPAFQILKLDGLDEEMLCKRLQIREFIFRFSPYFQLPSKHWHVLDDPLREWTYVTLRYVVSSFLHIIKANDIPLFEPSTIMATIRAVESSTSENPTMWSEIWTLLQESTTRKRSVPETEQEKMDLVLLLADVTAGSDAIREEFNRLAELIRVETARIQQDQKKIKDEWLARKEKLYQTKPKSRSSKIYKAWRVEVGSHASIFQAQLQDTLASQYEGLLPLRARLQPLGEDSEGNQYWVFLRRPRADFERGTWTTRLTIWKGDSISRGKDPTLQQILVAETEAKDNDDSNNEMTKALTSAEGAEQTTCSAKEELGARWFFLDNAVDIEKLVLWVEYRAKMRHLDELMGPPNRGGRKKKATDGAAENVKTGAINMYSSQTPKGTIRDRDSLTSVDTALVKEKDSAFTADGVPELPRRMGESSAPSNATADAVIAVGDVDPLLKSEYWYQQDQSIEQEPVLEERKEQLQSTMTTPKKRRYPAPEELKVPPEIAQLCQNLRQFAKYLDLRLGTHVYNQDMSLG